MMTNKNRALTLAVLLSCGSMMMPFYAYALGVWTISEDSSTGISITEELYTVTLNNNVTVQATGEEGKAVSFDNNGKADSFNVSGSLKGTVAAINISNNASVKNINILNGASIEGDILSSGTSITSLTFGGTIDNYGILKAEVDSDFSLSYNGNINGLDKINMTVVGGKLEYNGTATVKSVTINEGATLTGKGKYVLGSGTFTNNGTFDLGNGITEIRIEGTFEQGTPIEAPRDAAVSSTSTNANLLVDFNTDNQSDTLKVNGTAIVAGKITLTPQADYYFNGQTISLDPIIQKSDDSAASGITATPDINNISPVLNFTVVDNNTVVNSDGTIVAVSGGETPDCDYESTKYVIKVERIEQSYQSVATDDISSGIGSAIDIDSQKKKDDEQYVLTIDKQKLLTSLDFPLTITNTDAERKKVVSNNLKKLNPNVVGSQAQAVIETHTTLNNLVSTVSSLNVGSMSMNTPVSRRIGGLGPNRVEPPKYNSWRNIVIPFSSYTDQHNGSNGYTNHNSGVIGATERTFANGLTHGYHAALNHQSTEDSGSTIKGEGIYLGTHASYAPAEWNGWSVFGSARFGVEQMRSHRRVYISDSLAPYYGTADGDWTGYSGSFNIGAALTKEHGVVKSGPFAALDYSFAHRPSVHEDGGAVRTNLASATYDSLRTQLGYRLVTNPKPLDSYDSTQWQAHASVAWNHELLSDNGRTSYELAEFPGTPIEDTIETYGRDSMSIAAGVVFKTPNRLDVGLTLGSDIYRKGGSSVYGKVNFEWKF